MWRKSSVARATMAARICNVIVYTVHRSILAACGPRFCNAEHRFFTLTRPFTDHVGVGLQESILIGTRGISAGTHYRDRESLTNGGILGKKSETVGEIAEKREEK